MVAGTERPNFSSPADAWRASWQGRILKLAEKKLGAAVLSILAHNFDDDMPVLLRAVFPFYQGVVTPFFCSAGKIARSGHVCADLVNRDGQIIRMFAIWRDKKQMRGDLRRLADRAQLTDLERVEMFAAVGKWLVCDYRLDPTLDRWDPDAPRLTEPGMKLAHDPTKH